MFEREDAIFAFNIWDYNSAKSVIDAAISKQKDIILQTSTNVFENMDREGFINFVHDYSKRSGINAYVSLDHCKDRKMICEAIDCGWDIVMADGSSLSLEDNIRFTNGICEYAKDKSVIVEAELGQLVGVEEQVVVDFAEKTDYDDVDRFAKECEADIIAVAFGNAHGMYKGNPILDYDLVEYAIEKTCKPFVVHGGSGLSEATLKKLIGIKGVKKINISTELKEAYKKGIRKCYESSMVNDSSIHPIKLEKVIDEEIQKVVIEKLSI